MKVLVSGSSGFIGKAVCSFLEERGHTVLRLVRHQEENSIFWDPSSGTIDSSQLEGLDAVIHLAGENIASRWSSDKKRKIRDSRVKGTLLLSEALSSLASPPKVVINASAVGYYGNEEGTLTEENRPGSGFLADV